MIGPGTVYWLSAETPETCHPGVALGLYAATVQQHELYPWHDALPAVARWLADPATVAGLVDLLSGVDWHYETPEAERAGRALLAALEGDQAATVAANGGEK
jgi:hypothetical protein